MNEGAFGQPIDNRFPVEAFNDLLPSIYLLDDDSKSRIREFMLEHVMSRQAHIQLLITLAECIANLMQLIDVRENGPQDRVAILGFTPGASRATKLFGQIISSTVNGDVDTQLALIGTLLNHVESTNEVNDLSYIEAEAIGLLSYLMHEFDTTLHTTS
jgi:hypothetical protein